MSVPSRISLLALAGIALGACTTRDTARVPVAGPRYASLDATLDGAPATAARPATPMALLPEWAGRPRRVSERDEAAAFEQDVSIAAASRADTGENRILLRMPRLRPGAGGDPLDARPSEAGIRAELAAQFAGTAMRVVSRPASNGYGPYGLAVGRTARGTRCLYAWQWIEAPPALGVEAQGPVSLRVRLCRDDITLDAMAAAMDALHLVPRFEGRAPVAVRGRASTAPRRAAAEPGRAPAIRRDAARADAAASAWAGPPQAGRRYLGVAEASAPANAALANAASVPGPAAGEAPAATRANLPPEALLGPAARAGGRP